MEKVVGIDLGTTNSVLAYLTQEGKAEIIPNREGERILPSVAFFGEGEIVVGKASKQMAAADPLNTVQFVKRQMGNSDWRFRTERGEVFTAEEISALILKRLKEDGEEYLGERLNRAVITVPAYFNDAQRKATKDAGEIAGFEILGMINEPTAAAIGYGSSLAHEEKTLLVYDLGGGTFDVTILKVTGSDIDVLATGGDKNLGGFDWDNKLMVYLNEKFQQEGGVDLFADPCLSQDLREKTEVAKKILSMRSTTKIFLAGGGKQLHLSFSRDQFHDLTSPLLKRTRRIMNFVREDAGIEWSDLDQVLLVGGSTRMPQVSALIEDLTGTKPSVDLNPDEVVARGAAIYAGTINHKSLPVPRGGQTLVPPVQVTDVCSHSLGIVALDKSNQESNSIILCRNTSLPAHNSKTYHTVCDGQTEIEIQVTQGEDQNLDYITIIGQAPIKIPPYPKGAPVEVTFTYDRDGIIHITVFDLTANQRLGEIEIERIANLSGEEVKSSKEKINQLFIS